MKALNSFVPKADSDRDFFNLTESVFASPTLTWIQAKRDFLLIYYFAERRSVRLHLFFGVHLKHVPNIFSAPDGCPWSKFLRCGKAPTFYACPPRGLGHRYRAIGREDLRQAYEACMGEGLVAHSDSSGFRLTLLRYRRKSYQTSNTWGALVRLCNKKIN